MEQGPSSPKKKEKPTVVEETGEQPNPGICMVKVFFNRPRFIDDDFGWVDDLIAHSHHSKQAGQLNP